MRIPQGYIYKDYESNSGGVSVFGRVCQNVLIKLCSLLYYSYLIDGYHFADRHTGHVCTYGRRMASRHEGFDHFT